MAATRQAKIVLVGMVALSLAACGTTVRHHGLASAQSNADSLSAQAADPGTLTSTPGGTTPGATSSTASSTAGGQAPAATGGSIPSAPGGVTGGTVTSPSGPAATATQLATAPTVGSHAATKKPSTTATKTGAPKATSTKAGTTTTAPTGTATLSPVEIGIAVITDVSTISVGASAGNEQTEAQAAITYVNAHGGLDGHQLVPEFYSFQLADPSPYSTSMASICSSWTQDNHVALGMFVGAAVPDDLANCLNQHGVAYMSDGGYLHDATTYQQLPNLVSPTELDTSVAMTALLNNLLTTGQLTTKDKVGVLLGSNEDAAGRAYNNVILPTLKAKGISVTSYPVSYPDDTADAANSATQVQNDELHMATDGITRVILLAPGTISSLMTDASQQGYTPKYSLTTYDDAVGLVTGTSDPPASQLANASGIGWNPSTDVGTYGSTAYDNATTKLCRSIEAPTGQDTSLLSEYATQVFCNAVLMVQAAANASGASTITGGSLISGFNALGSSFPDSLTLGTDFSATKHDGDDAVRPFAYTPSCTCFQYNGSASSVS